MLHKTIVGALQNSRRCFTKLLVEALQYHSQLLYEVRRWFTKCVGALRSAQMLYDVQRCYTKFVEHATLEYAALYGAFQWLVVREDQPIMSKVTLIFDWLNQKSNPILACDQHVRFLRAMKFRLILCCRYKNVIMINIVIRIQKQQGTYDNNMLGSTYKIIVSY